MGMAVIPRPDPCCVRCGHRRSEHHWVGCSDERRDGNPCGCVGYWGFGDAHGFEVPGSREGTA